MEIGKTKKEGVRVYYLYEFRLIPSHSGVVHSHSYRNTQVETKHAKTEDKGVQKRRQKTKGESRES